MTPRGYRWPFESLDIGVGTSRCRSPFKCIPTGVFLSWRMRGPPHATLVAQLLDLQTRLSDAAVGMFVRLLLGLFTKARKGIERRYQATAREVASLMRMPYSTIEVLTEAQGARQDPFEVLDHTIGWDRLLAARPMAEELAKS
jgi:hypothetical protein